MFSSLEESLNQYHSIWNTHSHIWGKVIGVQTSIICIFFPIFKLPRYICDKLNLTMNEMGWIKILWVFAMNYVVSYNEQWLNFALCVTVKHYGNLQWVSWIGCDLAWDFIQFEKTTFIHSLEYPGSHETILYSSLKAFYHLYINIFWAASHKSRTSGFNCRCTKRRHSWHQASQAFFCCDTDYI